MGYDMSLEQIPAELTEAVNAHHRHMEKIYASPDGEPATTKLWDTVPNDPSYFRLNIWGMGKYIGYMKRFGMLATNYPRVDWKNFNDTSVEAPLAGEEPGIPIDKLSSNDHWLVRPEECASALKAYEQFTRYEVLTVVDEEEYEYWSKWIDFLTVASQHGGFRVD